jgi:hypothetical protein
MSHDWQTVYSRLPELPKLERVSLIFDRHGGGDGGEDGMHEDDKILHDCGVRSTELSGLLELLEKRIKDLSVRHLQLDYRTCQDDGNNSGVSRASILEGLQTLRLNVVHEQPQGEIGSVYKVRRERLSTRSIKVFHGNYSMRLTFYSRRTATKNGISSHPHGWNPPQIYATSLFIPTSRPDGSQRWTFATYTLRTSRR